jgi:hypothetical protein
MSKKPKPDDNEGRDDELLRSVALYRGEPLYNLARQVMRMTKTKRSMWGFVMDLGKDPLRPEELVFRTVLLYHIGLGENVAKALRIKPFRAAHRPHDPLAKPIAAAVQRRIDAGATRDAAELAVAKLVGKDKDTIHKTIQRLKQRDKR